MIKRNLVCQNIETDASLWSEDFAEGRSNNVESCFIVSSTKLAIGFDSLKLQIFEERINQLENIDNAANVIFALFWLLEVLFQIIQDLVWNISEEVVLFSCFKKGFIPFIKRIISFRYFFLEITNYLVHSNPLRILDSLGSLLLIKKSREVKVIIGLVELTEQIYHLCKVLYLFAEIFLFLSHFNFLFAVYLFRGLSVMQDEMCTIAVTGNLSVR